MLRISILAATSLLLLSAWSALNVFHAATNASVQVPALVIPTETPVTLVSAVVESEEGRQLSVLHYSVKNTSNQTIKRFAVGAYLVSGQGQCLRGEGWTIKEDVRPNATKQLSITLRSYLDQNGRLAVASLAAADQAVETKADLSELKKALKQIASNDAIVASDFSAIPVTTKPAPAGDQCDAGFCTEARSNALSICLGEGCQLSTFSCNRNACSYSFGCRCCTDGHCN